MTTARLRARLRRAAAGGDWIEAERAARALAWRLLRLALRRLLRRALPRPRAARRRPA